MFSSFLKLSWSCKNKNMRCFCHQRTLQLCYRASRSLEMKFYNFSQKGCQTVMMSQCSLILIFLIFENQNNKHNVVSWKLRYQFCLIRSAIFFQSALSAKSLMSVESRSHISNTSHAIHYTTVGFFKGILVAIRKVNKESVELTRVDLVELKEVRYHKS